MIVWLRTQIDWLKGFFSEPDGKGSMKRLLSFLVVIIFLRTWIFDSRFNGISDIPPNWMFLIAGIIGLGILDRYVANGKK